MSATTRDGNPDEDISIDSTAPIGPPTGQRKLLFQRYQPYWNSLLEENKYLRVSSLAFGFVALCCLVFLAGQGDKTRTIVVPFGANNQELWITGDVPSESYLKAISRNTVSLLGTFHGSSASAQFEELLQHVHPSVYDVRRTEWRELAKEMQSYREVSFATYIRPEIPIDVFADRIEVPARRVRFIGRTRREDTGEVHIGYVVENGRFWLLSYDFIEQGDDRVSTATE